MCEWMEMEISSNVKFSKLYPRGREAKNWGNIGDFRYVILQSTDEIFRAPAHGRHSQCLSDAALPLLYKDKILTRHI